MRLRQRLMALETAGGAHASHVVLWGTGQPFADALACSPHTAAATSRMLIELSFMGDDPLTPEQMAEQAKAYAWADELEAA